ncbi:hypothetical protein [Fretibacter rubidus]|uniref:hypothetical protein n=1 Tax=Fretibacter rubidus TaxID=570162 RepID=UPI003529F656
MIDLLQKIIIHIFGAAFVFTICAFIYKRHAREWEALAKVYGRKWVKPIAIKNMRSMVLYTEGEPARTYPGIMTIGVYSEGIGLKPIWWLAPFHNPVFIPFSDIKGWQQRWYWDSKSVELAFDQAPHLRIIMPKSQISWVSEQGAENIDVFPGKPNTGNWPYATQFMSILMLVIMVSFFVALYIKADGDWAEMLSLLGPTN